MTFSGQSYARWRLNEPMQRRFTVSLEIRTVQKSARLMHAVGRVDYSLVEVWHLCFELELLTSRILSLSIN